MRNTDQAWSRIHVWGRISRAAKEGAGLDLTWAEAKILDDENALIAQLSDMARKLFMEATRLLRRERAKTSFLLCVCLIQFFGGIFLWWVF